MKGRLIVDVLRASDNEMGTGIAPVRSGSTLRKKLPAALFFGPVLGLSSHESIHQTTFCSAVLKRRKYYIQRQVSAWTLAHDFAFYMFVAIFYITH